MGFWRTFGEALVPSQQTGETEATYRWRQLVAVSIFVMALSLFLTNALIWGMVQPLFPGFAGRDSLSAAQQQITDIRLDQISRNLRDAKTAECVAQQQGNGAALMFAQNAVMQAYQAYFTIMKVPPRIPDCSELVLATPQSPR